MSANKFIHFVGETKYLVNYVVAPRFGDYHSVYFLATSNQGKRFKYELGISETLKAILIGQGKILPDDWNQPIMLAFCEYVKSKLDEGYEKDFKHIFTSYTDNIFVRLLEIGLGMPQKSSFESQEWTVLKHLYDSHYQLINTDDTPISIEIISEDLKLNRRRTLDILKSLKEKQEIELMGKDLSDTFSRITPKGIKTIENR